MNETHTLELLQELGYAKQSVTQAEHIYLLSERGYAKLIKIMDTDHWQVLRKLDGKHIKGYVEILNDNNIVVVDYLL